MKTKMILIASVMAASSTVLARTLVLNCILGSNEKLQSLVLEVDDTKPQQGKVTLSNLTKENGLVPFERAETSVQILWSAEKSIVGATINMGQFGLISVSPIAMMNGSVYADVTASVLGFNFPEGIKAICASEASSQ